MDFERRIIVSLIFIVLFIVLIRERNFILKEERRQARAKERSLANLKCEVITLDLSQEEEDILNSLAQLNRLTTNQHLRDCIKKEVQKVNC